MLKNIAILAVGGAIGFVATTMYRDASAYRHAIDISNTLIDKAISLNEEKSEGK